MAIESIGGVAATGSALTQRAGLGQDDFLRVLLAQLTFQDPLKPLDNNEFIAQFAQLMNIQQTQELNEKVNSLLNFQAGTQAVGLLGRVVEVQSGESTVVGTVNTVLFESGFPELVVTTGGDSARVTLSQIVLVR